MRVLIIPSLFPSDSKSYQGSFILDQAVALSRAIDIAVLVPRVHSPLPGRGTLRGSTRSFEHREGVAVYRQTSISLVPRTRMGGLLSSRRAAALGFDWVSSAWGKPDVIHAHMIYPAGYLAVAVGQRQGIPVVLTEHSFRFALHLGSRWGRAMVRSVLDDVDVTLAVSPSLRKRILDFHGTAHVEVVGNIIPDRFFDLPDRPPAALSGMFTFACVALLAPRKGIDVLLHAVRKLKDRSCHPFRVLVVGDGSERPGLEELSRGLGTDDTVFFRGLSDREGVRDLLHASHSFVLPSLGETFSVATAEAMSCGLPVVATRCGGPESFVDSDTGILVEAGSSDALADGMAEMLATNTRFDRHKIRHSVTERFGEDAFRARLLDVYSRVMSQERA